MEHKLQDSEISPIKRGIIQQRSRQKNLFASHAMDQMALRLMHLKSSLASSASGMITRIIKRIIRTLLQRGMTPISNGKMQMM